jgi:hypothetical protein
MTEQILLRLFCSRKRSPHVLGSVSMDSAGLLKLRFKEAMRVNTTCKDGEDFEAISSEYVPEPGVNGCSDAYCTACEQRYFVPTHGIFAAAKRGRPRRFHLQGQNPEAAFRRMMPDTD